MAKKSSSSLSFFMAGIALAFGTAGAGAGEAVDKQIAISIFVTEPGYCSQMLGGDGHAGDHVSAGYSETVSRVLAAGGSVSELKSACLQAPAGK